MKQLDDFVKWIEKLHWFWKVAFIALLILAIIFIIILVFVIISAVIAVLMYLFGGGLLEDVVEGSK